MCVYVCLSVCLSVSLSLSLDLGLLNSVIYLDLAKAFDTVSHDILLNKLHSDGVVGNSLSWFQSYLDNRRQKCYVNRHLSNERTLNCGVHEVSILGHLLFLIYIIITIYLAFPHYMAQFILRSNYSNTCKTKYVQN